MPGDETTMSSRDVSMQNLTAHCSTGLQYLQSVMAKPGRGTAAITAKRSVHKKNVRTFGCQWVLYTEHSDFRIRMHNNKKSRHLRIPAGAHHRLITVHPSRACQGPGQPGAERAGR